MKKIGMFAMCMFAGLVASAQANVVKEAEHMIKASSPNYEEALKVLQPALTNPETEGLEMPWYLSGKANYGIYDNAYIQESLGTPLNNEQKLAAGKATLEGYHAYMKALENGQKLNEKGKPVGKKTKEILKTLGGSSAQLRNAGVFLYDAQDYPAAYDVWELYVNLPGNPALGKNAPAADPDDLLGQIVFYQALAKYFVSDYAKSLEKVQRARELGIENVNLYRVGMDAAGRLNDTITMLEFAQAGCDKFGNEDFSFIGQLINDKLATKNYTAGRELIERALTTTPDSNAVMRSQLYDALGYVYEQEEDMDKASENFQKAIDIDPSAAKPYFDLGRIIYNRAIKLDEEGSVTGSRNEEVVPDLIKAAELFEKAYSIDENSMNQIPGILYRLYYRLGPGYEDKTELWKNM